MNDACPYFSTFLLYIFYFWNPFFKWRHFILLFSSCFLLVKYKSEEKEKLVSSRYSNCLLAQSSVFILTHPFRYEENVAVHLAFSLDPLLTDVKVHWTEWNSVLQIHSLRLCIHYWCRFLCISGINLLLQSYSYYRYWTAWNLILPLHLFH